MPSLDLLRRLSDAHVLAELVRSPASRAQLAQATGLSKPTISESVRRLTERSVLREAGAATGGRGRVGTLIEIVPAVGVALAIHAGAGEVSAELLDARGEVRGRHTEGVAEPVTAASLATAVDAVIAGVRGALPATIAQAPVRAIAMSVADPVDPGSGRIVDLPGSPFLVGEADLAGLLTPYLAEGGRLSFDNDVNWSALAELEQGAAQDLSDVVQVHLGRGIGAAIVVDGRIVQGARGIAGEIAHLPWGNSTLVRRISDLGLGVRGQWQLDLDLAAQVLRADSTDPVRDRFVDALALACAGVATFLDPQALIFSGPLAANDWLLEALTERICAATVLPIEIRRASVENAPMTGARLHAAAELLDLLLDS